MSRIERDFFQRDGEDQKAFLEQTWCDDCQAENLGMVDPVEYEIEGEIFLEGKCKKCGGDQLTLIEEDFE
jgi:hypothetical protein